MTTKILFIALIGSFTLLASCKKIKPSKIIITEQRYYETFTELDVSDAFEVDVTYSDSDNKVSVEANQNLQSKIVTDITNGKLTIKLKPNIRIKSSATLKVHIIVPELTKIKASGASRVEFLNELNTNSLNLDLSRASSLKGNLNLNSCNFDLSGASNVELTGNINTAIIELSGASSIGNYNCNIDTLSIDLSGASSGSLTVNEIINIDASGASSLNYKGNGTINTIELTGASSINKK